MQPTIFITTDCVEKRQELWPDTIRHAVYGTQARDLNRIIRAEITIKQTLSSRIRATKASYRPCQEHGQRATFDLPRRAASAVCARRRAGDRLMLSWDEVRSLSRAGVTIGSHTVSHQVLARVDERTAGSGDRRIEARSRSKNREPRRAFSPTPMVLPPILRIPQSMSSRMTGYCAAVTTIRGVNRGGADVFRLRRTGIYLTDTLTVIKLKLVAESLLRG